MAKGWLAKLNPTQWVEVYQEVKDTDDNSQEERDRVIALLDKMKIAGMHVFITDPLRLRVGRLSQIRDALKEFGAHEKSPAE